MQDITLKSGNVLSVGLPEILKSIRLFNAVVKAFTQRGVDVKLSRETELNFAKLFFDNQDACIKGLSDIITSESVMNIILECGEKCLITINGRKNKINLSTFDNEDARGDFYEVLFQIAVANIKPFFQNLLTK
jgi:hypothetical protein